MGEKRSVAVAETNVVKVKEFASTTFIVKKDLSVGIIIVKENNMKQQTDVVNTHVKKKSIAAIVFIHVGREMELVNMIQIVNKDFSAKMLSVNLAKPILYPLLLVSVYQY